MRVMRWIAGVLIVSVLLGSIGVMQLRLTSYKDVSWHRDTMSFLPQSEKLAPMLMGFKTTFASYLWIKTMLYFGSEYMGAKQYRWLVTMVDMVTRLNPRFYPAYEFAGLMLPDFADNPQAAEVILQRGFSHFGSSNWKIPFYLGYLYDRQYNDTERAAQYFSFAGRIDGAPAYVPAFAATLYNESGRKNLAKHYLVSLFKATENPQVKEHLARKLQKLRSGDVRRHQSKMPTPQ